MKGLVQCNSALEAQQVATPPQDQNENQNTHEVEILKGIMSTCKQKSLISSTLVVADIVHSATMRTPAKVAAAAMLSLTKYYLKHVNDDTKHLADELVDFHSQKVLDVEASWQTCVSCRSIEGFRRTSMVHGHGP